MNGVCRIWLPAALRSTFRVAAILLILFGALRSQAALATTIILNSDEDAITGCTLRRAIELHDKSVNHEDIPFTSGCALPAGFINTVVPYRRVHLDAPPPLILGNLTIVHSTIDCGTIAGGAFFTVSQRASLTLSGMGITADDSRNVSIIDNDGGSLTIKPLAVPCTFTNQNSKNAPNTGGVIFNHHSGKVNISGAHFSSNRAKGAGGAIYNDSGIITIDDSVGGKNAFLSNHSFRGGAIYQNSTGKLNLTSSDFSISHNRADDVGGAIFNAGGMVAISRGAKPVTEIVVKDNHSLKGGGGLYSVGGQVTIDGIEVRDNVATDGSGGAFALFNQSANISRTFFHDNRAHFFGGAIYATQQSDLRVAAATFRHNSTRLRGGGGIDGDLSSQVRVINSTFVGADNRDGINVETGGGSVVNTTMLSANLTGPLSVSNSLLRDVVCAGIADGGLNLQCQSRCPVSIPRMDPMMDRKLLENNGGPTPTIALNAGSPAVDAISPPNCIDLQSNPVSTDQRGFKRPAGAACDIGAFELNAAP